MIVYPLAPPSRKVGSTLLKFTPSAEIRYHPEPPRRDMDPFFRDAQRIIHSAPFRNLQNKMVAYPLGGDISFRTPMTHTMEVVSVAVSIALNLGLNQHLDHSSLINYTIHISSILYFQRNTTGAALISSKYR
jgi:dGTP triphosphohydrolase